MASLQDILEGLSSSDNLLRKDAESRLENAFAQDPDSVLIGIVDLAKSGNSQQIRLQAFPLLRRLAFRSAQSTQIVPDPSVVAWDGLKKASQEYIQGTLISILPLCVTERNEQERNALVTAISQIERKEEERGHSWQNLVNFLSTAAQPDAPFALKDAAFKIHAECIAILQDIEPSAAIETLMTGLKDSDSPGVQLSALKATTAYITQGPSVDQVPSAQGLLLAIMEVVFSISKTGSEPRLTESLKTLIELFSYRSSVKLLLPNFSQFAEFLMTLVTNNTYGTDVHHLCIELFATFAEQGGMEIFTAPYLEVWKKTTELFLSLMSTIPVDQDWQYNESIQTNDDDDHTSSVAEQALDRIALCYAPAVLPTAFSLIPSLIQSQVWKERHAGLAALGTLAESCTDDITPQLGGIVQMVRPTFKDEEMRVQYAAIYAISQLASFFEGELQRKYGRECLSDLTESLSSPQPRIQAYAAAALVNFLEDIDTEHLVPYIETILNSLLAVLENSKLFVQNKVLSAIASLASAAGKHFNTYYSRVMPLLLGVLERGEPSNDETIRAVQGRALECAGRVAAAVDPSIFAPDATRLIENIFKIQSLVNDDDDELRHYCMQALSCTAKGMGQEGFHPYLDRVANDLIQIAKLDLELTRWDEQNDDIDEENEVLFSHNGEICKVYTASVMTKTIAIETLVVLCAISEKYFVPYVQKSLEVAMPVLSLDFTEQLRESAVTLICTLVEAAIDAGSSQEDLYRLLNEVIAKNLFESMASESYPAFVTKLSTGAAKVLELIPGVMDTTNHELMLKAIEVQLYDANVRYQARQDGLDEATETEIEFAKDIDTNTLMALSTLIRAAYRWQPKQYPESVMVSWFEKHIASNDTAQKLWALRLLIDTVEILGEACPNVFSTRVSGLVEGLQATEANFQQTCAYGIGVCAEFGAHLFDEIIISSIDTLLKLCVLNPQDDEDQIMVKDNALATVAKILSHLGTKVDVESIIPKFLDGMPILLDEGEVPVVYEILLGLIERQHPLVSPDDPARAQKVITWLRKPIDEGMRLPEHLQTSLAVTLNMYTERLNSSA